MKFSEPVLRRTLLAASVGASVAVIGSTTRARPEVGTAHAAPPMLGAGPLKPEMFGTLDTPEETTEALRQCLDAGISSGAPIELTGRYLVQGAITRNTNYAHASLDLRLAGDVVIEVAENSPAIEYFLVASSESDANHSISGGSLTILCNGRVQRALAIACGPSDNGAASAVEVSAAIRVKNVYAPVGSSGVAYAVAISGPFAEVIIRNLEVDDVSRHPVFAFTGDCKGLRIDRTLGSVTIINPRIRNVRHPIQDADGIFIMGLLDRGDPTGPLVTISGGIFEDCQGRSIKTQVSHTRVYDTTFVRQNFVSIRESCDVDTQYGSLELKNWRAEYRQHNGRSPLGRNHCPVVVQALYGRAHRHTTIGPGILVTDVAMSRFAYINVGINSPDHDVVVERIRVIALGDLGTSVFRDALVGFRTEGIEAAQSTLTLTIQEIDALEGVRLSDSTVPGGNARSRLRLNLAPTPAAPN